MHVPAIHRSASGWLWTAFAFALLAAPASAAPDDTAEIDRCATTIRVSQDPVERSDAVRRMGKLRGDTVPVRLGNVVRRDDDAALRVEAAEALAVSPEPRATTEMLDLLAWGGPMGVRAALGRGLGTRRVPLEFVLREIDVRKSDPRAVPGLIEALGANRDPAAAGYLEMLARTRTGSVRAVAIHALAAHPSATPILPDLIADLLETETDIDCLVELLTCAEKCGDARIRKSADRLAAMKSAPVSWAYSIAEAHVADRAARKSGEASGPPPRIRDRVDRMHVVHQTEQLPQEYLRIREELTQSRPAFEDVRIGVVGYLETNGHRQKPEYTYLAPTRDVAALDAYFTQLIGQTSKARGIGSATAIEAAFARTPWRAEAVRTVILHADVEPNDMDRAREAVRLYTKSDGVKFRVEFLKEHASADVPKGVATLAKEGGTDVVVWDPERVADPFPRK